MRSTVGWLLVLVFGAFASLEMWTAQSDRYYKKVFSAYVAVVSEHQDLLVEFNEKTPTASNVDRRPSGSP